MATGQSNRAAAAAGAPAPKKRVKVRAKMTGYYDHIRRREGDVFVIADEKDFSERWMERVDARTPERTSTAQQELTRQHDEILASRAPAGPGAAAEPDVI